IEYNVRMGDPETQAVIPRIKSDFLDLLYSCGKGTLGGKSIEIDPKTTATVVMVSGGYPGNYEKGNPINGLGLHEHGEIFHAGTAFNGNEVVSSGGRVLAVTSFGNDLPEAINFSYNRIKEIHWKDCYYRNDIGQDLIKLNS
ncbi:MAG: phosphoribosylamine--glycine ligase, partial [Cyclobacteriaceae bacterium]|nr:phosphoribosylamine--glycine ligase [Cyclobacteriaceae bacterium]